MTGKRMSATTELQRTILVTAANGKIGTRLVPRLSSDPVRLVLPTSNAERLKSKLPSTTRENQFIVEEGSVQDPIWMEEIMEKHHVDTVFLCLAGQDEMITTLNLLELMHRIGSVKHLVYVSAAEDYISPEGFERALRNHSAAHVIVKPIIERKLQCSGYPWTTTVLGPSLFFDDDLRSKEYILDHGFFDEPLGEVGVSRVSEIDIAEVARNALMDPQKWAGKKIMIGSKHRYTGSEITKLWSAAVGKPLRMCESNQKGFEDFERNFAAKGKTNNGGKAWARDLRHMLTTFCQHGFGLTDEEYDTLVECLGREPMSYPDYVAQTGKSWVS